MLPPRNRMRRADDFAAAVRRGRRAGRTSVVVHLSRDGEDGPCLVGFVVSKQVGTSVVRSRVKRRLRHVLRDELPQLPSGGRVVVRACPASASATWEELVRDVRTALGRVLAPPRGPGR